MKNFNEEMLLDITTSIILGIFRTLIVYKITLITCKKYTYVIAMQQECTQTLNYSSYKSMGDR